MFNDSDSFYYSPTGDLTNSVQRRHEARPDPSGAGDDDTVAIDDRFFWNKHMLLDLVKSTVSLAFKVTCITSPVSGCK